MATVAPGLRFRTLREMTWQIPERLGMPAQSPWRVPAGTKGKVHVNEYAREVGYYFEGIHHPWGGPAPSTLKPGMELPDWIEPLERNSK